MLTCHSTQLKSEVVLGSKSGGGKAGDGFDVTKSGDVRVGMVSLHGWPSFTTLEVEIPSSSISGGISVGGQVIAAH